MRFGIHSDRLDTFSTHHIAVMVLLRKLYCILPVVLLVILQSETVCGFLGFGRHHKEDVKVVVNNGGDVQVENKNKQHQSLTRRFKNAVHDATAPKEHHHSSDHTTVVNVNGPQGQQKGHGNGNYGGGGGGNINGGIPAFDPIDGRQGDDQIAY